MLILTEYILKKELWQLSKYFNISDILKGAEKISKNLAIELKSLKGFTGLKFYKVRIGSRVKGRMVVFVVNENGKIVPVLIRLKKDKIFGMNMSLNNSQVVKQIDFNLEKVLKDIESGSYEEIPF